MFRRPASIVVAILAVSSCGSDATVVEDVSPGDVVEVRMEQNAYSLTELRVSGTGSVEFDFDNVDRAGHEAFVGTEEEQAHSRELRDASNWIELGRHQNGRLSYTFDQPGTYVVGCHIARHYEDGMRFSVVVS